MPLFPPNLTVELSKNDACSALFLSDITGVYGVDGNVDGYGVSGGVTINDVTGVTIVLTYNSLPSTITYGFTVALGIITACTLTIGSGTPADIFDELTSTVWPFESTDPFNLFGDYGVSIPEFADEVFSVLYTITGVADGGFEYSADGRLPVVCASQYCVDQMFVELDWECECVADSSKRALLGQSYINQVVAATAIGDLTTAITALNKVKAMCNTSIGGCGC